MVTEKMRSHGQILQKPWTQACMNTWTPVGGTVGDSEGGVLWNLEEVQPCWKKHVTGSCFERLQASPFQFTLSHLWQRTYSLSFPAKATCCHVSFTIVGLPPATVVIQDKLLLCHFWSRVFLSQQKRSDTLGLTHLIFTATLWGMY